MAPTPAAAAAANPATIGIATLPEDDLFVVVVSTLGTVFIVVFVVGFVVPIVVLPDVVSWVGWVASGVVGVSLVFVFEGGVSVPTGVLETLLGCGVGWGVGAGATCGVGAGCDVGWGVGAGCGVSCGVWASWTTLVVAASAGAV